MGGVKAGTESEAGKLRKALAETMFSQCEADRAILEEAAMTAADKITALEDKIRLLESKLLDAERLRLSLLSKMEAIEATEAALEREKVTDLTRRLERVTSDLSHAGRSAANADSAREEATEELEELRRDNVELAKQVERSQLKSDGLEEALAALQQKMKKAGEASAAKISTLQSELSASRGQVAAILAGVASIQDNLGKE